MSRIETPEDLQEFFETCAKEIDVGEYWDALGMSREALYCIVMNLSHNVAEGFPLPAALEMAMTFGAQLALRLAP
jgi:hypothetical protein